MKQQKGAGDFISSSVMAHPGSAAMLLMIDIMHISCTIEIAGDCFSGPVRLPEGGDGQVDLSIVSSKGHGPVAPTGLSESRLMGRNVH